MHYPGDNISGLMVGQGILAQILPTNFHDEYGADVDVVKKAIEKATYDWTTFEDSDCFKDPKYKTLTAAKPGFCFDTRRELPSVLGGMPGVEKSSKKGSKATKSSKNDEL